MALFRTVSVCNPYGPLILSNIYSCRCVSQEMVKDLLGITPGASPPASNASPKSMKPANVSPQGLPTRRETGNGLMATASFGSEKLFLRLGSSGSVPPALLPRSDNARRVQNIMQCARMNNPHRPGAIFREALCYTGGTIYL